MLPQSTLESSEPQEEWRPVPGYEGWYDVSSLGRVRRMAAYHNTFAGKIIAYEYNKGRPYVRLWRGNRARKFSVAYLVAEAFLGIGAQTHQVRFRDGDASNVALPNIAMAPRNHVPTRVPIQLPLPGVLRYCHDCGLYKAPDAFGRKASSWDGLATRCRVCDNLRSRAWRAANRERAVASTRRWNQAHKEGAARRMRERLEAIWADDERLAQRRRQKHEEGKRWRAKNPIKQREYAARRRLRRRDAALGHQPVDYEAIVRRDGHVCHLCGETVAPDEMHFDHVIPLSRGGAHAMDNIKVAHALCNRRKCARLP